MKRLLALFLTVILAFSVTACGDEGRRNGTFPAEEPEKQEQERSAMDGRYRAMKHLHLMKAQTVRVRIMGTGAGF